jgi:hypothetical protein
MKRVVLSGVAFLLIGSVVESQGATVTMAWEPSTSSGVTAYVLHYGTVSGVYDHHVQVGNVTQYTLSLTDGFRYYIAVTAQTSGGVSSAYSQELMVRVPQDVLSPASDLLLQNTQTGALAIWRLNGPWMVEGGWVNPPNPGDTSWKAVATGDFDANGSADVLWRRDDATMAVWFMQGFNRFDGSLISTKAPAGWEVRGTEDFDRDGKADILWSNPRTGAVSMWLMDGLSIKQSVSVGTTDPLYRLVASCDLTGDGLPDLLWQHQDGLLAGWRMNGTQMVDGFLLTPSRASDIRWKLIGCKDLDADGRADLIWRDAYNPTVLATWIMQGSTMVDGALISNPLGVEWRVVQ